VGQDPLLNLSYQFVEPVLLYLNAVVPEHEPSPFNVIGKVLHGYPIQRSYVNDDCPIVLFLSSEEENDFENQQYDQEASHVAEQRLGLDRGVVNIEDVLADVELRVQGVLIESLEHRNILCWGW